MKKSPTFWLLMAVVLFTSTPLNGVIGDMVPMLTDRGVSRPMATSMVTLSGLALIAGRFLCGYLLDRFHGPYVAAGFFLVSLAGAVLVSSTAAGLVLTFGAVLLGLALGAEIAWMAFFAGRYFGLRTFGLIYGFATGTFVFAAGIGQWLMNLSFEMTRSYNWALGGFGGALLISSLLVVRLGPYQYAAARAGAKRQVAAGAHP
jgi:MFS family permease